MDGMSVQKWDTRGRDGAGGWCSVLILILILISGGGEGLGLRLGLGGGKTDGGGDFRLTIDD